MITKEKVKNFDFAYSVGYIKTQEALLLNKNEVDRMTLASNLTEAFKVLNETDYADNKSGVTDSGDFQKVLDEGLLDIKKMLDRITPNLRILDIIWFDYDFHNIKTLLKAKLSGKTYEDIKDLLMPMGAIEIEHLKKFILDKKDAEFNINPQTEIYLKKRIQKLEELFEKTGKNPQVIDLYMDQKLMKIIYHKATDSKSQFLIDFIKMLIDLNNIKLFLRMWATDKDFSLYELAFLWNGYLEFNIFKKCYDHDIKSFLDEMKKTRYAKIVAEGYKRYEKDRTFIFLEKEISNFLITHLKQSRTVIAGPEPLIAYYLAKKNNAQVIRTILVHKSNNTEIEEIKEKIGNIY